MSRKIRVAMLIQAYWPHVGGAEKQLAALAPLLKSEGIDMQVLTRRYPGMKPFERVEDIPVYRIPAPGPKAVASLAFTAGALRLLRSLKPDLIHAHELLSPTTTAIAAKRLMKTPVVAKVLRGGVLGDLAKLRRRKSGGRRIEAMCKHVDAFITISQEIEAELASMGAPPEKRVFIPNGVDVDRFRPVTALDRRLLRIELGLPAGPIAVFAGRFVYEKRVENLIEIWPSVRRKFPYAGLILLGNGPQNEALRAMAGDGVRFPGVIEDVHHYLQAADLFVLPSSTEGLSNSLLEAMATGLACVATAVGGAPDLITDGVSGRLAPPDDPASLERIILELFASESTRRQLGEGARQVILSDYTLRRTAERIKELYERLLPVRVTVDAQTAYSVSRRW